MKKVDFVKVVVVVECVLFVNFGFLKGGEKVKYRFDIEFVFWIFDFGCLVILFL